MQVKLLDKRSWILCQTIATMKKVEGLYIASKEKWDAEVAAVVNEMEELEAKVVAKELASKRTDADADELVKHWEQKYEAEAASRASSWHQPERSG